MGGRAHGGGGTTPVAQDVQTMPHACLCCRRSAAKSRAVEHHRSLYAAREIRSLAAWTGGLHELPRRCNDEPAKLGPAAARNRDLPLLSSFRSGGGRNALLRVPHLSRSRGVQTTAQ